MIRFLRKLLGLCEHEHDYERFYNWWSINRNRDLCVYDRLKCRNCWSAYYEAKPIKQKIHHANDDGFDLLVFYVAPGTNYGQITLKQKMIRNALKPWSGNEKISN